MQPNVKNNAAALRSARVLIVDEDFTTRRVIRTLLLWLGVTDVHDAGDGESGLAAVTAIDPDVVILDWQMAGMHGAEFVRRVRSPDTSAASNVPIIMLTGHGEQSRVIEAMRLGVHGFLVKPVSGEALQQRLASVRRNPRPTAKRAAHGPQVDRAVPNMVVVD
jgi:two-component system chemotaxis response regulator CheY